MDVVFWEWGRGGYSRLHKQHPTYSGFTWCGAIYRAGGATGISHTFHSAPSENEAVSRCPDCFTLRAPCYLTNFEPDEKREADRRRRQEIYAIHKRRRERNAEIAELQHNLRERERAIVAERRDEILAEKQARRLERLLKERQKDHPTDGRKCPICHTVIIAPTRRQVYCSLPCVGKARHRAYVAKKQAQLLDIA